jgi:hypothetical protein
MDIEFDPTKDQVNVAKHGISLSEAENLEWETLVREADSRQDYGEVRMIGYVLKGDRIFCVVFTERAGVRRIISLRKANKREVKRYAYKI